MQCIRPIKAGFDRSYNLIFKQKLFNPEIPAFAFPCRKCLPCRLKTAREKGIRSWHESQMHNDSIFATFTYAPEHLKSPRLNYLDFQLFMRRLRESFNNYIQIPFMVTGEYGEQTKRPHWHALLFNYRPKDQKNFRTTDLGHTVYHSEALEKIWQHGMVEYGEISLDAASYVARYGAKKLVHGKDEEHTYHPHHRTSSRYALGKKWMEQYYRHPLENGFVYLPNGSKAAVPRYYVDWAKKTSTRIMVTLSIRGLAKTKNTYRRDPKKRRDGILRCT